MSRRHIVTAKTVSDTRPLGATWPPCALCRRPAGPRTLELRVGVAPWLQRPGTPLCPTCERWLADPARGLRARENGAA